MLLFVLETAVSPKKMEFHFEETFERLADILRYLTLMLLDNKDFDPTTGFAKARGTSILGEVRNVEISGATQQLLCSKSHDFQAVFALAHSKINQIA